MSCLWSCVSFGFGGTNAHCILETFVPKSIVKTSSSPVFMPLTLSAASPTALRTMISWHLDYLMANPDVQLADFAYTLQHRRSTLPYRKAFTAGNVQTAIRSLQNVINPPSDSKEDTGLGTRFGAPSLPSKVIGIFTGQGAQWPRMGAELIESSAFAASRLAELDAALQKISLLRQIDRPGRSEISFSRPRKLHA